jgi:hypothetical protein
MPPTPVSYGLFLCDLPVVEANTGKVSLINTFSGMGVPSFPAQAAPFAAYAVLTDSQGDVALEFVIVALDTGDPIYSYRSRQTFASRLQEVQYLLRIRGCILPRAGRSEAALFADRQLVARRPFSVYQKGPIP